MFALVGANVFDGKRVLKNHAVLIEADRVQIIPDVGLPQYAQRKSLAGGTLMPGFVDLQVNGGGGVMFNDAPTIETLKTIAGAHWSLGTRIFLPTLITDRPDVTTAAIRAASNAIANGVPGIAGLHLEGPHLDPSRAGAHDPALIRPMTDVDVGELVTAAQALPNLMVTLAPEAVTVDQVQSLAAAGIIISLGHTDCHYDTARAYFDAGASCVTHLFNAMSQLGSRAPGLVGAALNAGVHAGLIADGIHVASATIQTALSAKAGPGSIFLVTDAMACAGSEITTFTLNGREVSRQNGQLRLADGTLAGADLSMARALQVLIEDVGEDPATAFGRATARPAALLPNPSGAGGWPAKIDQLIHLSADYTITAGTELL